jgi:2-isopropylmalate synthase
VAEGDGPINALDAALRSALKPHFPIIEKMKLTDYKVRIVGSKNGTAAKTRVFIESTDGISTWSTVGASYDIIEASWIALRDSFDYFLMVNQEAEKRALRIRVHLASVKVTAQTMRSERLRRLRESLRKKLSSTKDF